MKIQTSLYIDTVSAGPTGITVLQGTVITGAIGFMRIMNKSRGTLAILDFLSPDTWS